MSVASWCCKSFCVVPCVSFCTGHFVMVPLNMTYLHCLQHSFFEHLFNLYIHHIEFLKTSTFYRLWPYRSLHPCIVTYQNIPCSYNNMVSNFVVVLLNNEENELRIMDLDIHVYVYILEWNKILSWKKDRKIIKRIPCSWYFVIVSLHD